MGAKCSKPKPKFFLTWKDNQERFNKNFEVVPIEDLVVGRKYHVWKRGGYSPEGNYRESHAYLGFELRGEEVFLKFKDRYKPAVYDRWGATFYPEFHLYRREDIVVYKSRDTLAVEQASRGLANKLPEDTVHIIKSMLIGEDRNNRYPTRGLQPYSVNENYFSGGLIFNTFYKLMGGNPV
jgi:hypothetical protein